MYYGAPSKRVRGRARDDDARRRANERANGTSVD
jgi:hypothetical protein